MYLQVTVWSRTFASAEKCATEIGGVACHTAQEAVSNADVIVTVTGATTPVLESQWVKPTAHINGKYEAAFIHLVTGKYFFLIVYPELLSNLLTNCKIWVLGSFNI